MQAMCLSGADIFLKLRFWGPILTWIKVKFGLCAPLFHTKCEISHVING